MAKSFTQKLPWPKVLLKSYLGQKFYSKVTLAKIFTQKLPWLKVLLKVTGRILIVIQILNNHYTKYKTLIQIFLAETNNLLKRKFFIHSVMIVAEVFFFNMYFVSAQVLFEKMREMIHFLPDPKPSLKVS